MTLQNIENGLGSHRSSKRSAFISHLASWDHKYKGLPQNTLVLSPSQSLSMADVYRNETTETTIHDETCPLLRDPPTLESQLPPKNRSTPLPIVQLVTLCAIRLSDPIAFTQIFPYINEMIENLHLTSDPSKIGFYSGLVESTFAFFQLVSIYHWARWSDMVGRRPVIFIGIIGTAAATVLFGVSQSFAGVLSSRALAGLFSGVVAVFHSILGEITDSTNQDVAFPIYGFCWPLGAIIGPLLGGALSNPATRHSAWFDYDVLRRFPYLLPCVVAAGMSCLSVIVGSTFLDETLPSKKRAAKQPCGSVSNNASFVESQTPPSITALLSIPAIRALCLSGCVLSVISTSFDVVFVLFCYTPIHAGGLAFSASQIGYSLAIAGGLSVVIQLFIMPSLMHKFGMVKLYRLCMAAWPFAFSLMPCLNAIVRLGINDITNQVHPQATVLLWIGIFILLALIRVGNFTYSVSMILVKENAPSPASLGTANGLAEFSMSLSRSFSPVFIGSVFALSKHYNLLDGQLWAAVMVIISAFGCKLAAQIGHSEGQRIKHT